MLEKGGGRARHGACESGRRGAAAVPHLHFGGGPGVTAMRSDAELRRDVLDELRRDERLHIEDLDVRVEDRVVTLTGRAETPVQCWRALQVARYVAGLARVSNRIVVRPH